MFFYHGSDLDCLIVGNTPEALKQIRYFQFHKNFGKRVSIRKPRFIPIWMCYLFFENFGKEGYISFIEFDNSYNRDVYTVLFPINGGQTGAHFFEDELVFR